MSLKYDFIQLCKQFWVLKKYFWLVNSFLTAQINKFDFKKKKKTLTLKPNISRLAKAKHIKFVLVQKLFSRSIFSACQNFKLGFCSKVTAAGKIVPEWTKFGLRNVKELCQSEINLWRHKNDREVFATWSAPLL